MTVELVTFGCRLNTYESEVMRNHALAAGLSDVIIFNTCAVTAEAEKQARQAIRRARREKPGAQIIVTGCSAQVHPETYGAMPEVNKVVGNAEKLKVETYTSLRGGKADEAIHGLPRPLRGLAMTMEEKILVNDIMSVTETASHLVAGFEGRARAFVQVQNGCNHRCTFCIIPFGRGNSRSVPMGEIVSQVRLLVEQGYKEVVLTGVDVSDYGKDLPGSPTLGSMMKRLLALVPELPRLRLSSIDAVEVDDDLLRLIADEPRLMPHIHVSLQAGDDMILKRMKRRHLRRDAIDFCAEVRRLRPDVVFGADLIAGFPTETDAMFENTMNIVDECGLTYLHVFPYSEREGTPAAKMPQLPKAVRKERAERLRAKGKQTEEKFYKACVGKDVQLLVERGNVAHTEHYAVAPVPEQFEPGTLVNAKVTGANNGRLEVAFA